MPLDSRGTPKNPKLWRAVKTATVIAILLFSLVTAWRSNPGSPKLGETKEPHPPSTMAICANIRARPSSNGFLGTETLSSENANRALLMNAMELGNAAFPHLLVGTAGSFSIPRIQDPGDRKDCVAVACGRRRAEQLFDF